MKIYRIDEPRVVKFARSSFVGSWWESEICPQCKTAAVRPISPLLIEWEPGCDEIPDFSWCSYACAVKSRVVKFVREQKLPCRFRRTEVVPPANVRKREIRVAFPYTGPILKWLYATSLAPLNEKLSRVKVELSCDMCGRVDKTFKYRGIVIDRNAIGSIEIFRITQNEPSDATFVTESLKRLLEAQNFTNLAFYEAGMVRP